MFPSFCLEPLSRVRDTDQGLHPKILCRHGCAFSLGRNVCCIGSRLCDQFREAQQQGARLYNTEMLKSLKAHLEHLDEGQSTEVIAVIKAFPSLFGDVPGRTMVLEHDVDVGESAPVKQHPYRVNITKRAVMKEEVTYLLKNKLAVPSTSPVSVNP